MATEATEEMVEAKARELYEASRKRVAGRPAWERLDMFDGYDAGMRARAIAEARAILSKAP